MLNGFYPKEASKITGLSVHMLNYLARHGYLLPAYGAQGRGKVRYYSYRDLVIARIVSRLLAAGLEISRLKEGIANLVNDPHLAEGRANDSLHYLATDGASLYFIEGDGCVRDLTQSGQLAFAFLLDLQHARDEVLTELSGEQLKNFSLKVQELRPAA